jgi:hypothetical protein
MTRPYPIFLFVLLLSSATAQSWCPPGAEWTFHYADVWTGTHGVQRVEYLGDTVVGGFSAQRLKETRVVAPWGSTNYSSISNSSIFTRYESDVVHVWDGFNTYDTLFWFGAVPGDHWHAPFSDVQEYTRLTVTDTSTVMVQGVPLRQFVVQGPDGWDPDTLHERIGFSFLYLNGWSWFLTDQPWSGLKCYRDDDLTYSSPLAQGCDFTLGVAQERDGASFRVQPNPGTDHFTLDIPPGLNQITLFDAQGRQVLRQQLSEERPVISTAHLPSGIYHVHFTNGHGRTVSQRWLKQ